MAVKRAPDGWYAEASHQFMLASNALTDAIMDKIYPSKVAQVLYRFSVGCIALGKAKQNLDLGLDVPASEGETKQMLYAESKRESIDATESFVQVQERL